MEKKIQKLLDQKMAIVGSTSEDKPYIKVMGVHAREGDEVFIFASNNSAIRTAQWLENPNACLYFYKATPPSFYKGVMIEGTMEVLSDQETKDKYWRPTMKLVYKGGKTDPDFCILRFTGTKARYYESLASEDFNL